MLKYVARRLVAGLVLLVAVATVTFLLLGAGKGDIGRQLMGVKATQEQVAQKNRDLGLKDPLLVQYGRWAGHAAKGDLGTAWFQTGTVTKALRVRVPITVTIVGLAVILAAILAVGLGTAAAVRGQLVDRSAQLLGLLGFALPGFLIAIVLISLFSVRYHIFRATGYTQPSESLTGWIRSIVLPVVSLAIGTLASVALQVRGSVKDALDLDYVRTLRSRGLSSRRVLYRHVLRNSAGPALAIVGLQFIGLLGGAVIIEQIFAIPGIGSLAVDSAAKGDIPIVMGIVLVTAMLVVLVNLVVDLLTAWLNPKVRLG
jgi:peptide/nickel transport system permease protein